MWDVISGQESMTFKGHMSDVLSVAFSPDGERIASGSYDKTVKVWEASCRDDAMVPDRAAAPPMQRSSSGL